jgi:hypothetical protein
MKQRLFTRSTLEVSPLLSKHILASPLRRLNAFIIDSVLLVIPTFAVTFIFATFSLYIFDANGFNGIRMLLTGEQNEETTLEALIDIAPLLVRIDAPGLPTTVKIAVEESDFQRAGDILAAYELEISLAIGGNAPQLKEGYIRIEIKRLIPNMIRGFAIFGTAIFYFTFLTAGNHSGTFGKRLLSIRVARLDGRPLSYWESFELIGGYLASVGTFGIGFLDLWRDPNRRLAHDRISNTVVIRKNT